MNKYKSLIISFLALIFLSSNYLYSQTQPGVSVWANKKSFSPGESGVLMIKFKTGAKVKIPRDPAVTVSISSGVNGNGLQNISGSGDYIDSKLVKYNFTVPSDAVSGTKIKITGTVKFGYCSAEDETCKIGNSNFTTSIKVK